VVSVASAEDVKVAAGPLRIDAERLLGRGDSLVVARGQICRFQGAYASLSVMRRLMRELVQHKQVRTHRAPGVQGAEAHTPLAALAQRVARATRHFFHRLPALPVRAY
jgi:hypothetical protein